MCGRFAQQTDIQKLARLFKAVLKLESLEPRYNIAPTAVAAVIRIAHPQAGRTLEALRWGLIPSWAKDPAIGNRLANARAETVAEKPSFRSAFRKQRCLVPVNGFYEWKQDTKPKQPFYFSLKDSQPFALAALWEYWEPKEAKGENVQTFTLITTSSNEVLQPIHDRMPVILDEKDYEAWLNPAQQDVEKLKGYLKPFASEEMQSWKVSTRVNHVGNEGPQCVWKYE
jgi:putative SOS response-associated peptidase YedK